jgi:hypothetical protein
VPGERCIQGKYGSKPFAAAIIHKVFPGGVIFPDLHRGSSEQSGVEQRIASLPPTFNPVLQDPDLLKTLFPVLGCHTDSAVFILSIAVKNYFPVPGKCFYLSLQPGEGNCTFQMILGKLGIIGIGADQQSLP